MQKNETHMKINIVLILWPLLNILGHKLSNELFLISDSMENSDDLFPNKYLKQYIECN